MKEQRVERRIPSNVDGTQSVIVYHARYLVTGKHLRAILEYEGIDYIPAISNLMQRVMLVLLSHKAAVCSGTLYRSIRIWCL